MKYLLILISILFSSLGLQAQQASPNSIEYQQYDYNNHIASQNNARDAILGGIIVAGLGVVLHQAGTYNPNYETNFINGLSMACIGAGGATVILGTYSFVNHKTKARKIQKKFNF